MMSLSHTDSMCCCEEMVKIVQGLSTSSRNEREIMRSTFSTLSFLLLLLLLSVEEAEGEE